MGERMTGPCAGTAGKGGTQLATGCATRPRGGSLRRARVSLTMHYSTGKFSRLHHAVNCLRQNEMRRFIGLLLLLVAAACGGGGNNTDRRTPVDSPDNYDPPPLDPPPSPHRPPRPAAGHPFSVPNSLH